MHDREKSLEGLITAAKESLGKRKNQIQVCMHAYVCVYM